MKGNGETRSMHGENDASVYNFVKIKTVENNIWENFESVGELCYNIVF
jgi:hypothetical protein